MSLVAKGREEAVDGEDDVSKPLARGVEDKFGFDDVFFA